MALPAQKKIWDHFQSQGEASFTAARYRLNYLFQQAAKYFPHTNVAILNVGVGNGWLEQTAQQKGWQVAALDPSAIAIEKLAQQGICGKVGDLAAIPYDDAAFDVIFCSEVFEHLSAAELPPALRELVRVLKTSGRLIGTVPFAENLTENQVVCPDCGIVFHRWGHQQSFTPTTLAQVLTNYFAVRKIKVMYFLPWQRLNWKGKFSAFVKKIFSLFGIHGKHENIYFEITHK